MVDIAGFLSQPGLPLLLSLIVAGVLTGYVVGALPGFDITTGVALLLPLSYIMDQSHALAFFAAMYCAGVFGGSITAILFRIPGTSESVMSAIEGYPFTEKGEAGRALGLAIVCSGFAGIFATFVLMGLSPVLADWALKFGPGDYAALGIMGCAAVVSASGGQVSKGLVALLIGLFASTIGPDPTTGAYRFAPLPALRDGIGLIPALIGLFAAGDVLWRLLTRDVPHLDQNKIVRSWRFPSFRNYLAVRASFVRGWGIGMFTGVLPGAGASTAAFIAHSTEAQVSREKELFGRGSSQALAAPETAKNAAAVGALIPLMALGIPGSGTAAVILGAFEIHNLQVGPLLFAQQADLVNTVFFSVLIANAVFMLSSLVLIRPVSMLTRLPYPVLATAILTLSVAGSLATGGLMAVQIMVGCAALSILFRSAQIPLAPIILGLVLGPIIEVYGRRGLIFADGDLLQMFSTPLSLLFLTGSAILLLLPAAGYIYRRYDKATPQKLKEPSERDLRPGDKKP